MPSCCLGGLPSVELVRQKCFVYSDWEALLPNRVITAVSGRLQKILANYATKFAA